MGFNVLGFEVWSLDCEGFWTVLELKVRHLGSLSLGLSLSLGFKKGSNYRDLGLIGWDPKGLGFTAPRA